MDVHAQFFRDNPGKGCLAEPRRTAEQAMVQRVATVLGGFDCNRKALFDVLLSGKLFETRRSKCSFNIAFVA